MGFKDIVSSDLEKIFLNQDEFADYHTINGKTMVVLVDDNEMIEREKRVPMRDVMDGTYSRTLMLYVASNVFGPLPAVGRLLNLDGKNYHIVDAVDENGIYSISLKAVRAR